MNDKIAKLAGRLSARLLSAGYGPAVLSIALIVREQFIRRTAGP